MAAGGSRESPEQTRAGRQRRLRPMCPPCSHCDRSTSEAKQALRGFPPPLPECLTASSNNPAWASQTVHASCWKGPCCRQPDPLGKAGRLDAELPWERGCVTPTPRHPRARHTAFNHPPSCVSLYSVHLLEETLVWSARTYYTWLNNGCQNKCNLFWGIWGNQGWNLLPTCQTKSKH